MGGLAGGKKPEEIEELSHEQWPGYRAAFYIVFGLGIFWLFYIFNSSGAH